MNDFLGKLTKDIAKNDNKQHRNILDMGGDKCNHDTYHSRVLGQMISNDELMAIIYGQWSVIIISLVVIGVLICGT
jgi:hypothetical protein